MDKTLLYQENWNSIPITKKKEIICDLIKLEELPFSFEKMECFTENKISMETAVLSCEDEEFVFIPGIKNIELGWDIKYLSTELKKNLEKEVKEYNNYYENSKLDDIDYVKEELEKAKSKNNTKKIQKLEEELKEIEEDNYGNLTYDEIILKIKESVSPLRKINISPMIVKRELQPIGLKYEGVFDRRNMKKGNLSEDAFQKALKVLGSGCTEFHLNGCIMYDYSFYEVNPGKHDLYDIYSINKIKYEDFLKQEKKGRFSILTEDEWEYICGNGTRTLFRWGNNFDYSKFDNGDYYSPNIFGLYIAYNPYEYEVVDSLCTVKGGDGGCACCGGDGEFYSIFPLSPYYRDNSKAEMIDGHYYFYRKIYRLI